MGSDGLTEYEEVIMNIPYSVYCLYVDLLRLYSGTVHKHCTNRTMHRVKYLPFKQYIYSIILEFSIFYKEATK